MNYAPCSNTGEALFRRSALSDRLALGNVLPADKRKTDHRASCRLTGLKPELIEENDLRVEPLVFMHNLLKDCKLEVGAF
jgi:hypothetical protein